MNKIKLLLTLIFMSVIIIFAAQNFELLEVKFLVWTFTLQRAVMLFGVFVVGIAVGYVLRGAGRADPE